LRRRRASSRASVGVSNVNDTMRCHGLEPKPESRPQLNETVVPEREIFQNLWLLGRTYFSRCKTRSLVSSFLSLDHRLSAATVERVAAANASDISRFQIGSMKTANGFIYKNIVLLSSTPARYRLTPYLRNLAPCFRFVGSKTMPRARILLNTPDKSTLIEFHAP